MRFYRQYQFMVGRKLEFKDLFSAVDAFLSELGLSYTSMGYHLKSFDDRCYKLSQKMPQLGPLELIQGRYNTCARLTNMIGSVSCDEASIRFVGSKIPRTYNFLETDFYYQNIDFDRFPTPCIATLDTRTQQYLQVFGSFIQLHRNFEGPQSTTVLMSAELSNAQSYAVVDDYAKSLSTHLGNAKYFGYNTVFMDSVEKERFEQIKSETSSAVKIAQAHLHEKADQVREQMLRQFPDIGERHYQIRPILQRIAKQHGLDQHVTYPDSTSYFYKQVRCGVALSVQLLGSSVSGVDMGLMLSGPGFSYPIVSFSGCPANSAEAKFFLGHMMDLIDLFEKEYMDAILAHYPKFPDWTPVFL